MAVVWCLPVGGELLAAFQGHRRSAPVIYGYLFDLAGLEFGAVVYGETEQ